MSDIDVTLQLPAELVEQARERGILSNDRIARFLRSEIERAKAWQELDKSLDPVRESFRAEHDQMTEDEVMDMINEIVHEVRREQYNSDA